MSEILAHHGIFRDTKLHVDDYGGGGRPVVLIHGWPLSGESFKYNVPALREAGYQVITYDRRGFGRSDKPRGGYEYDTLSDDLHALLLGLGLEDVTLVGFSMAGGEVARYAGRHASDHVSSVVFASAVPPYLLKTDDNPDGPLTKQMVAEMVSALTAEQREFYDRFITDFFSVGDTLMVSEAQRQEALMLCLQADKTAALGCMAAFGTTDFRQDLTRITMPTLVLHGEGDKIVPFQGSGMRTHQAIAGSELQVLEGAPHGCNVSHADQWNSALLAFLAKVAPTQAMHRERLGAGMPLG